MKVGFIGAGHIARALAEGWSRPELVGRPDLVFRDVRPDAACELAKLSGGDVASSLTELVRVADVVIVAVRPTQVEEVLAEIGPALDRRPLVSVAAGVSLERLQAALPEGARVGRVMPNVAAALGLGVFLTVPGTLGDDLSAVRALFELDGRVVLLDEQLFDAATAVAGCMPGMLAVLVNEFAHAAERHGVVPDVARELAAQGVHGAAAIIAREGDPTAVIRAAATPGGMTAAAISALEEREIAAAVRSAVDAATARAKELA